MRNSVRTAVSLCVAWAFVSSSAIAAEGDFISLSPELVLSLDESIGVSWQATPLEDAAASLPPRLETPVLLDRRLDPNHKLDLVALQATRREVLEQLAVAADCGCRSRPEGRLLRAAGNGATPCHDYRPAKTTGHARAAENSEATATGGATRLPLLAEPRLLIAELCQEAGLVCVNLDDLPHDLWRPADLGELPWTDRLSLILIQFDAVYQIEYDAGRLMLGAAPREPRVVQSIRRTSAAEQTLATMAESYADFSFNSAGGNIEVTGLVETLRDLNQPRSQRRTRTSRPGRRVVQASLKAVDEPLARCSINWRTDSA